MVEVGARCVVLVVGVAALAACAPGTGPIDLTARVQPDWTVDAALVGAPAAAHGVVVSYVDSGVDALQIVAWAADSGTELWRDSAGFGSIPRYGVASAEIVDVDGAPAVAYLQDDPVDDRGWQRVVVADLETGQHRDDGTLVLDAVTLPGECDDAGGVCLRGRTIEEWESRAQLLRVDLAAGRLAVEHGPSLPRDARFLGEHVYATLDRAPEGDELIGYAGEGVVLWERPYTEVFAPGYSSDGGWSWLDDDSATTIIGTGVPYESATRNDPVTTYDLGERMIVGLDPDTGDTRWSVSGADRWCDAADTEPTLVTTVIPACVFASGTTTIDRTDPDYPTLSGRGIEARIVGLDAATGEERWSVDAGSDPSVARDWESSFTSRLAVRPVTIDGSVVMVDVLTGRTSDPPSGAGFACSTERTPFSAHRPGDEESEPDQYSGGFGVYPCDGRRDHADDGFSSGALAMAATEAGGGWSVVGGSDGLSGYRVAR